MPSAPGLNPPRRRWSSFPGMKLHPGADDQVALEATSAALPIARILEPHVGRVVVATKRDLEAIAQSKAKTDRIDAKILARLLSAGLLAGSWLPDETSRAQRRRLVRRALLVRARTRSKNEIHGVVIRNLKGKPPMSDMFGKSGRGWLAALDRPADEREAVEGCCARLTSSPARSR